MTVDRHELVDRVRAMGPVIAERAVRYDREASFPFENFADFRRLGLLALCIPTEHGGLGASYADYVRVSEEIGRYCGATALTFNMHNATDVVVRTGCRLADHVGRRAGRARADQDQHVPRRGRARAHPQPTVLARAWRPAQRPVLPRVRGRSTAVGGSRVARSSPRCRAPPTSTTSSARCPATTRSAFSACRRTPQGVTSVDDWDPLGMRGTVSRTLLMDDVFVPADNEWLPAGHLQPSRRAIPLAVPVAVPELPRPDGGVLDTTRAYLRGELPGQAAGRPARSPDEAGRLGADATAPSAGQGVAVPRD